jgi:DNA-binding MarR family transcriptional regulator
MTVEQYILNYSTLPQNGTHTMSEHLQAMALATYGEYVNIDISEQVEQFDITTSDADVILKELNDTITISETSDKTVVGESINLVEIKD